MGITSPSPGRTSGVSRGMLESGVAVAALPQATAMNVAKAAANAK